MATAAWRRFMRGCVVRGCKGDGPICRPHWMMMPILLRERWLEEIAGSGRWPSKSLIDEVNNAVSQRPVSSASPFT